MWIEQAATVVVFHTHLVTHKGFWGSGGQGGQTSVKTVVEGGEHLIPSYEQVNGVLAANKPLKVSILVTLKAVIYFFPA